MAERIELDFYFDVSCRWAWWTSIWLRRVAKERPISINWKVLSLAVQDNADDYTKGRADHPQHVRDFQLHRPLVLARRQGGNDALDRLHVAYGNAIHGSKADIWEAAVQAGCLAAAGLPASLYDDALTDPSTETEVIAESREALERGVLGTPAIAIAGTDAMLFGPIIGAVPSGPAALALWDSVHAALQTDYFFEIKRNRRTAHTAQFAD